MRKERGRQKAEKWKRCRRLSEGKEETKKRTEHRKQLLSDWVEMSPRTSDRLYYYRLLRLMAVPSRGIIITQINRKMNYMR